MVPRGGIEPPTQGFSEYCSTKNACKHRVCEGIKISVRKNVRYMTRFFIILFFKKMLSNFELISFNNLILSDNSGLFSFSILIKCVY